MQTRTFGERGPDVPVLGLGTWQMERDERARCVRAIEAALDAGMTHLDTAELYGQGEVETIVGEAIRGRRDEVFLVSKVVPSNASRSGTIEACERSLARLGTDHLDAYLLHWPGSHPLEDTVAAFERLREDGKIRQWGVSNFDHEGLAEVVRLAGDGVVACNQVLYHLKDRSVEHHVHEACLEHGVALVGYSPFGSGDFPDDDPTLAALASERGATPRQLALAFLTRLEGTFAIPKSSSAERVRANAVAAEVTLDDDAIRRIDEAFPLAPWRG